MALIRWGREDDLFSQLDRMQREMHRLMSDIGSWLGRSSWPVHRSTVYPPLNIYNDGEGFVVRAEVPGVDPKSLDVEVTSDTLTIRGERRLPELPEGASYHRRERDFGQFRRSLTLPDKVDSGKVVATCQDGILDIRLPYAEEAKARKITVQTG